MGQQIVLYGSMAEQRFDEIGQIYTGAKDRLEILKGETEGLTVAWQGKAQADWSAEFNRRFESLKAVINIGQKNIAVLKQVAGDLAEEEKKIVSELESFF
ncbi:MAG: hypothetical protein IJ409_01210 [Lachnospiraceae bacterium]|nr:hypothetical protein [Lachnospiraceae bacterium]